MTTVTSAPLKSNGCVPAITAVDAASAVKSRTPVTLREVIGRQGLHLDNGFADPVGAIGGTLAAIQQDESRAAVRSLTVLPSHADCAEAVEKLAPVYARAYPQRTRRDGAHPGGNCDHFEEAEAASKAGGNPGVMVCPACPSRDDCVYHRLCGVAANASHAICVTGLFTADPLGLTLTRDVAFVVTERGVDILRPVKRTRLFQAETLEGLALLRGAVTTAEEEAEPSAEEVADAVRRARMLSTDADVSLQAGTLERRQAALGFWVGLCAGIRDLEQRVSTLPLAAGTGGLVAIPSIEAPQGWGVSLWAAVRKLPKRPHPTLVNLFMAMANGQLAEIVARREGGHVVLEAKLNLPLLASKPTVLFDCTTTAAEVAHAVGGTVDPVESTELPAIPVEQALVHITAKTRPATATDLIRARAATCQAGDKLGILCHRKAWSGVKEELARRPVKAGVKVRHGFWHGDMSEVAGCKLIVALGVPQVPPEAIARRLRQTGRTEEADRGGDWGPLPWEATLQTGEPLLVARQGYRNPAWQEIHQRHLEGILRRTMMKTGSPTIVLSDERLNLAIATSTVKLNWRDGRILQALENVQMRDTSPAAVPKTARRGVFTLLAVPAISPLVLSQRTGLSKRTVGRRLARLAAAGFVVKVGRGRWSLPTPLRQDVAGQTPPASVFGEPSRSFPDGPVKTLSDLGKAVVKALVNLVRTNGGTWEGSATQLDGWLAKRAERKQDADLSAWVGSSVRIGKTLRRLAGDLDRQGIKVGHRKTGAKRLIVLTATTDKGEIQCGQAR